MAIELIQTPQLTDAQQSAVATLRAICKQADGNAVAIYPHMLAKNRGRPANVLCYTDHQLVGFLAAFFFHANQCEIGLMVAPSHRRQTIATQLLHTIRPLLEAEGIQTVLFSTPHQQQVTVLKQRGFCYHSSEYQMHRKPQQPVVLCNPLLPIRTATIEDLALLCIIDAACFPDGDKRGMQARLLSQLQDDSVQIVLIHQNNLPVGKAHLNWQSNGVRLSDIAVLPDAQGQGIGSALLAHCIQVVLINANHQPCDLWLDVESKNQTALGLYTRLGFTIDNAHDYWSIDAPFPVYFASSRE